MSLSKAELPFGVRVAEGGVDRYRCDICLMEVQGYQGIDPHCRGRNHEKRMLNFTVKQHYLPTLEGQIPERLFGQIDLPMDLVWNGFVRMNMLDHYWCEVCNKPVCGVLPARQHSEGESHRKKLRKNTGQQQLPSNIEKALDELEQKGGPIFKRDPQTVPAGLQDCFCRVCGVMRFGMTSKVCEVHMQRMGKLSENLPQKKYNL